MAAKNKTKSKGIREIVSCFFVGVALVFLFFAGLYGHSEDTKMFELPDAWEVSMGDKTFKNISLVRMSDVFTNVKKGDVITLIHPLYVDSHDPLTLRVYSRLSSVRVMVDDRQIYSYGVYDVLHDRMVGSGYHFVLLPTTTTLSIPALFESIPLLSTW